MTSANICHVVAWKQENGQGFMWFHTEFERDAAWREEMKLCDKYVAEGRIGVTFDIRVTDAESATKEIAESFDKFFKDMALARYRSVDEFTLGYIGTALWSSTDDKDEHLDKNYNNEDIAPESLDKMIDDCREFQRKHADLLEAAYDHPGYTRQRAGHDFWLTRCGHGAGFWDRGLGGLGNGLTEAARQAGNVDLYVGDDGQIYQS